MTKIVAITLTSLLSFTFLARADEANTAPPPSTAAPIAPAPIPVPAATPAPTATSAPAAAPAGEEKLSPLGAQMKKMGKSLKQLRTDLKQPVEANKKDYLDLVATLKTATVASRDGVPNKATDLPADDKAKMVADYQKAIDELNKAVDVLADDIQKSQWDAATKQIDVIIQQEKDGHKAFRKKED